MKIKVKILDERLKGEFALPDYQTCMSAGMDFGIIQISLMLFILATE